MFTLCIFVPLTFHSWSLIYDNFAWFFKYNLLELLCTILFFCSGGSQAQQLVTTSMGYYGNGCSQVQWIHASFKDVIKVFLDSSRIPIVQLVEGLPISDNPLCEIDGVSIGPEYCKVFVLKRKVECSFGNTSRGQRKVGEAVGRYVVWR